MTASTRPAPDRNPPATPSRRSHSRSSCRASIPNHKRKTHERQTPLHGCPVTSRGGVRCLPTTDWCPCSCDRSPHPHCPSNRCADFDYSKAFALLDLRRSRPTDALDDTSPGVRRYVITVPSHPHGVHGPRQLSHAAARRLQQRQQRIRALDSGPTRQSDKARRLLWADA